jgi:acetolactate synthase-1/2/3 large subunit
MLCSEKIAEWLAVKDLNVVFAVTGGAIMGLTDALANNPDLRVVYNHHEQASVMAAEGFARVTGKPGVAFLTIGPGATNGVTGLVSAWMDSIPLLVFSGQSFAQQTIGNSMKRQVGIQEADIIRIVDSVSKKAFTLTDCRDVLTVLEESYYTATQGRMGPVWIEIPVNIQRQVV